MRFNVVVFFLLITLLAGVGWADDKPTSLLIVTGGHGFEEDGFFEAFRAMEGVTWQHARYGGEAEKLLTLEGARGFDVILYYDMNKQRGDWQKGWLDLFDVGKPAIFLHHALGSYPDWHDYIQIVGGHANFSRAVIPGMPNTKYKHDVMLDVHIVAQEHPITRGIEDFEIHDEVYKDYVIDPAVNVLLTTSHPDSDSVIGWTHHYQKSTVVYLQLGHGPQAYSNPNFRELVRRSVLWAAGRLR